MAPVLKKGSLLGQLVKVTGIKVADACVEDMFMGAVNDRNRIDLDIAESSGSPGSGIFASAERIRFEQSLACQGKFPGVTNGQDIFRGGSRQRGHQAPRLNGSC